MVQYSPIRRSNGCSTPRSRSPVPAESFSAMQVDPMRATPQGMLNVRAFGEVAPTERSLRKIVSLRPVAAMRHAAAIAAMTGVNDDGIDAAHIRKS